MERAAIFVVLAFLFLISLFAGKSSKKVDKYICRCKGHMGCGEICCVSCVGYPECPRNCGGSPSTCGKSEVLDYDKGRKEDELHG